MSTKATIRCRARSAGLPGVHLYDDVLDSLGVDNGRSPVYLCLEGVEITLRTLEGGGASITVTLPREVARDLGVLRTAVGRDVEADFRTIENEMAGLSYEATLLPSGLIEKKGT